MTPAILTLAETDFRGSWSSPGSSVLTKKKGARVWPASGVSSPQTWETSSASDSGKTIRNVMAPLLEKAAYAAPSSLWNIPSTLPSVSRKLANQPTPGMAVRGVTMAQPAAVTRAM